MKKLRAYLVSAILVLAWSIPTAMVVPHVAYAQAASCAVSGGRIIIIGGKAICFPPSSNACPVTVGTLTLNAIVSRSSAISPALIFFDATASTDTATLPGANTVTQDVNFAWNFGDSGASGTGTWAFGSNPGNNTKNASTGIVGAHLYIVPDGAGDKNYTAQVVAFDGTNTASCNIGVTAFDPIGANGFSAANTTCFFNSSVGSGCPSGATQTTSSNLSTALSGSRSNKRALLKCGDTFTGTDVNLSGTKWSVGAYGGCEGAQTNLPIINSASSSNSGLIINASAGDGRISDLDCEGAGTGAACVSEGGTVINIPYQITLSNLKSTGNNSSYFYTQGAQWGLIGLVQTDATNIATFINLGENNPCATSVTNNCNGFGVTNQFNNINYQALMGSSITGINNSGTGSGIEVVRISACRMCVISNNSIQGANGVGADLKIHNGNTFNSCGNQQAVCCPGNVLGNCPSGTTNAALNCQAGLGNISAPTFASCWTGQFTEYLEISDNSMGLHTGAQMMELAPQNTGADERLRNIVVERNFFVATTGATDGSFVFASSVNTTIRDNIFFVDPSSASPPEFATQVCARPNTVNGVLNPPPTGMEVYSNTMLAEANQSGMAMVGLSSGGPCTGAAAANSFAQNNLFFTTFSGHSTVNNTGSGNAVMNNTVTPTNNPSFTTGSGNFSLITDFKPTANFTITCTPFP